MSKICFCIVQGGGAGVVTPGNENNQSDGSSAQRSIIGIQGLEPSIRGNDGDMDTRNHREGRTNESNNGRVVDGADENDNMSMDSNDETLTDGMKGIILFFK